jgi:hypothetical protein
MCLTDPSRSGAKTPDAIADGCALIVQGQAFVEKLP